MYIAPNSVIRILKNVPLDLTYDHTIYFSPDSAGNTAQYNYFVSKTKYTLTEQSYQRVKRGWMRVNIVADNLYDCNYLMFQNTNFPDPNAPGSRKWFYAFIKSVEYINNAVSEIEFEIDVMQTWNSEYALDYCFVDREHSATDLLGGNTVEENLDIGDSYVVFDEQILDFKEQSMFACYADANGQQGSIPYVGTVMAVDFSSEPYYAQYYTPLRYKYIGDIKWGRQYLENLFDELQDLPENSLMCAYQYPKSMFAYYPGSEDTPDRYEPVTKVINIDISNYKGSSPNLNGISIKNRKLLTSPYTYIRVSNSAGNETTYALQYFDYIDLFNNVRFMVEGSPLPEPQIILYPLAYKGVGNNINEGIEFDNYIITPQVVDQYRQWWYENKYQTNTSVLTSAISNIAQGAIYGSMRGGGQGAIAGAGVGAISSVAQIANTVAKINDIKATPDKGKSGSENVPIVTMLNSRYGYTIQKICPIPEKIHIIDEYFTRYGYATHRTKIPNRNVRPHWTYTKTIGCTITGSVPCDDMKKICSIYDNGITFWKNGDEIGNYALENSILS